MVDWLEEIIDDARCGRSMLVEGATGDDADTTPPPKRESSELSSQGAAREKAPIVRTTCHAKKTQLRNEHIVNIRREGKAFPVLRGQCRRSIVLIVHDLAGGCPGRRGER